MKKRFTEPQIVGFLREADAGVAVKDLCRKYGGHGQGSIFHAGTTHVAAAEDPAIAGENLDISCTGLTIDSAIPPQVAIGGRMAAVQMVRQAPGVPGVNQVRVRVPTGVEPGFAVAVRLTYVDRPSNEVTIAVRGEDASLSPPASIRQH